MINFFYNLRHFLANVWAYRDILWHDRDWDHHYLVALVERKLSRMYTELGDPNRVVAIHTRQELRRLQTARALAKRLVDCNHTDLAGLPVLKAKYGDGWWYDDGKDPVRDREVTEWARHATYLENQDWNMLWDTIKKFSRRWWD